MRHIKQSSLEVVFHYRCGRGDRRFAALPGDCSGKGIHDELASRRARREDQRWGWRSDTARIFFEWESCLWL